ncbi:RING-H2 finger protein ATL39-like [Miscanthus floridulus]|uniref:RING-H2 finger protein ATL39-like n=1 Tax=Miscanthus floridulus TaxID=154761 RepID=UPI003459AC33
MANHKNNGGGSMYYYRNNPSQTTDDEEHFKKTVAIALPVFILVVLLLRLLCFWIHKDNDEEDVVAGPGNRVRQRRQSSGAGGWVDRAPSSTVAGASVEVVSPVRAAEPPLVCMYRKADGWREGSCGVCLAELADGEVLRVLPACMHYFHAACVGEWLRGHDTCPLCRAPLVGPAAVA